MGIGDRTDNSLQAHAGGEQPLDDDVVHVSRDSFSVVEDSKARFVASYTGFGGQSGSDVSNRGHDAQTLLGDGAEEHFDGELGAVLAAADQGQVAAHRTRARSGPIAGAMGCVHVAVPFWQQRLDGQAQQFAAVVAEQCFDLFVDEHEDAVLVGQEHAVGR